jgi:hypothetical protein
MGRRSPHRRGSGQRRERICIAVLRGFAWSSLGRIDRLPWWKSAWTEATQAEPSAWVRQYGGPRDHGRRPCMPYCCIWPVTGSRIVPGRWALTDRAGKC